jgi:hypothetical protein
MVEVVARQIIEEELDPKHIMAAAGFDHLREEDECVVT